MGDRELTELLIAKGADVNARNIYDRSPLDYAINRKSDDVVEVLRQHGAK